MKDFWDQRYSMLDYVYGQEPNAFFKQQIDLLSPGKILLPAEGEGRNAVYASLKGWVVNAFDYSRSGQKKAYELAKLKEATIHYQLSDLHTYEWPENEYDLIGLFYTHQTPESRKFLHKKVLSALKKDGIILLEAFSKKQLPLASGGPKNIDMLYSSELLLEDFSPYQPRLLEEKRVLLKEGAYHKGEAEVLRLVLKKT